MQAALEGSDEQRRSCVASIRDSAMAQLTLSDGFMARAQASSDFANLRAVNGLSSMYTAPKPRARGRVLPGGQLPAARARVVGAVGAKGLRRAKGHAQSHSAMGGSGSDSDGEGDVLAGRSVGEGSRPKLPWGSASKYQWEPPVTGRELVGWVVMAYFSSRGAWYDGVVVRHGGGSSYTVFYEEDDEHEDWEIPDNEIVFRRIAAGSYRVSVSGSMLPSFS